jgi:hypothetical protein
MPSTRNRVPPYEMLAFFGGLLIIGRWLQTRAGVTTLTALLTLGMLALGAIGALSYRGYCIAQHRYLSDDEYIAAAIDAAMKSETFVRRRQVGDRLSFTSFKVIPHTNVTEFHEGNPGCCRIINPVNAERTPHFWDRVWGTWARTVELDLNLRYVDEHGTRQVEPQTWTARLTNCGLARSS